ncbi:MAG: DeoR/GlpR family DNA-binding transcription regulator [Pseudomonadota bacterium]
MSAKLRQLDILHRARSEGHVSVETLADTLGVTLQTIRRDLADLASAGQLERVHGGAVVPSGTVNIAYEERRRLNEVAKARIAARAARLIPNDICLFVSIGTTAEAVARALHSHSGLMVVTNNINVAQILSGHPDARIVLTGGTLRHTDGGLTGPLADAQLAQFRFDLAVIGCSAIDAQGMLLDFDMDEVRALRGVIDTAKQSCLVVDQSKFARHAPMTIAPINRLDQVITDAPLPDAIAGNMPHTDILLA